MVAKRISPTLCRIFGLVVLLGLAACHQPPTEIDGHKVTKTKRVNGKDVNMLESTDQDLDEVRAEAKDMKKSTDKVVFTPEEQQTGK